MKKIILLMMAAAITLNSFATENRKQFTLRLIAENAADDKAYVNFDQGFTNLFAVNEDAEKIQGTAMGIPVIYTLSSDNIACATNNLAAFGQDQTLAVGVNVDADGRYTFRVEDMGNFMPSSILRLEDKVNSTFVILNNRDYSAMIGANDAETGRFYLHVMQSANYSLVNANCSNAAGGIAISYNPSIIWTSVALLDSNNLIVSELTNVADEFSFTNLTGGTYRIQYTYANDFTATESVNVESAAVEAVITNTNTSVAVNQEVQFTARVNNATTYEWIVNDGTLVSGIVNTYYTFYDRGDFTVIFKASNDLGCQSADTVLFSVQEPTGIIKASKEEINIWAANNRITVNIPQTTINNGWVRVYNLLGTEIYTRPINSSVTEVTLSDVPNSYYIVSVENNKMKRTQKVFIGNR